MLATNVTNEFERESSKMVENALERAMRSMGYRLKLDMANAIRTGMMGWPLAKKLTLVLREHFRTVKHAGVWFARFVRYEVLKDQSSLVLRVGVFNPQKIKPLSLTILRGARKLVSGWSLVVTDAVRKGLIRQYLKRYRIKWDELTPRQKERVRKKMREAGVLVKTGTVLHAPPRTVDIYMATIRERTLGELQSLFSMALRGERWPKKWWIEVKV